MSSDWWDRPVWDGERPDRDPDVLEARAEARFDQRQEAIESEGRDE
jgi:hypothetical protein